MTAPDHSRLSPEELADYLCSCPPDLCDLILETRAFILGVVPEVHEGIKFNSLCYFKPNAPYGAIGGHVCGIGVRPDQVSLSFIHGAALPDPQGVLHGTARYKREVVIESSAILYDPAIAALLKAARAFDPAA